MWDTLTLVVTKIFKSKTLILNWLMFAVGLLGFIAGHETIQEYPEVVSIIVSVVAALNVVIRGVTFLPLEQKGKPTPRK